MAFIIQSLDDFDTIDQYEDYLRSIDPNLREAFDLRFPRKLLNTIVAAPFSP